MQARRCTNGHTWQYQGDVASERCPHCGAAAAKAGVDVTIDVTPPSLQPSAPVSEGTIVFQRGAPAEAADAKVQAKEGTIAIDAASAPQPRGNKDVTVDIVPAMAQSEHTVDIAPAKDAGIDLHSQTVNLPGAASGTSSQGTQHIDRAAGTSAGKENDRTSVWGGGDSHDKTGNFDSNKPDGSEQTGVWGAGAAATQKADGDINHSRTVGASNRTISGTDEEPEPDVANVKVPGYRILSELGRGGMGVVYKARQEGLKRLVALKMILAGAHAGADQIARFRSEAEAVAHLQHPNIVQVYDIGEQAGCPFFSLEYVDGKPLDKKINAEPQPARQAAEYMVAVSDGMFAAHTAGIIHRDLKPANILLMKDGTPKITDFGLAKRFEEGDTGQTRTGAIMGTPSYMPPEQASGKNKELGPAADIYSLGAILYELLTGRPPFRGETPLQTLKQVLNQEPVAPTRLVTSVPRDLETICLKALDKAPVKRYGTAGELAADLRRFLNHEPILARPTPVWERTVKWARRRPEQAALAGVIAAAVLVVASLITVNYFQVKHERDEAQIARDQAVASEVEAKRQEALAVDERNRAERNFQQAQDAVDQMLTRVAEKSLAKVPGLEGVRRKLLSDALVFYQRFSETEGESAGIRFKTGQAHQRVGDIQEALGAPDKAEKAYRDAIRLFEQLSSEEQAEPTYRGKLAASYNNLGILLHSQKRREEAEKAYHQALTIKEDLAAKYPAEPDYRLELANAYVNDGNLQFENGKVEDATKEYRQGLSVLTDLVATHPANATYRREAIRIQAHLGTVLINGGKIAEGEEALRESAAAQAALVARDATEAKDRFELARMTMNLGAFLQVKKQNTTDAEKLYRESHGLLTKLAEESPNVTEYRQLLVDCCKNLGVLLRSSNRHKDGEPIWREAIRQQGQLAEEFPSDPSYRRGHAALRNELAIVLASTGRTANAETEWREAGADLARQVDGHPKDRDAWYALVENRKNYCALLAALGRGADEIKSRRELIALLERLDKAFPAMADHKSWLGQARFDLAVALFEGNQLNEASRLLHEAIRDQRAAAEAAPKQPAYRQLLAGHYVGLFEILLRQGDHVAAAAAVEDFTRDVPAARPEVAKAAESLAQCVPLAAKDDKLAPDRRKELAGAYASQTVQLLRQAVDQGFKNLDYLRNAAAFAPLRAREDFKKLLADVEAKNKAALR